MRPNNYTNSNATTHNSVYAVPLRSTRIAKGDSACTRTLYEIASKERMIKYQTFHHMTHEPV